MRERALASVSALRLALVRMSSTDAVPAAAATARRALRIYTKTGDGGESSLYNGQRRAKDADFFVALGDVDELNGHLGLAREHLRLQRREAPLSGAGVGRVGVTAEAIGVLDLAAQLGEVQSRLLDLGSAIATPQTCSRPEQLLRARFDAVPNTALLETWVDAMDERLPPLRNFILPGGGLAACQLHVARSVCRRAERQAVRLVRKGDLAESAAVYLNRLSDYLFMAARFASLEAGAEEAVYKKAREPAAAEAAAE